MFSWSRIKKKHSTKDVSAVEKTATEARIQNKRQNLFIININDADSKFEL